MLDGEWTWNGGASGFIKKYSSDGLLLWSKILDPVKHENFFDEDIIPTSTTVSDDGYVYTTGYSSYNFTSEWIDLDSRVGLSNVDNVFVSKHSEDGDLVWMKVIESSGNDYSYSITSPNPSSVFVTGKTVHGFNGVMPGFEDLYSTNAFIAEVSADGDVIQSKIVGGVGQDIPYSISSDGSHIYVAGETNSEIGGEQVVGEKDAFLMKLSTNSPPEGIDLSPFILNENITAGTAVGTLSTTDSDSGDTFTYSLVSGTGDTDNSAFSIVGDQLNINASPDYETKSSYSVRVRSTDAGGLTFDKALALTINDINEDPTDLSISASAFDENITAGSVVAELRSTDEDSEDTHTYSLVSGDGLDDNGSFEIVGDELKVKESPDFETKSSYSIRIETKDSGGLTLEKSFTLYVNDLEESVRSETSRVLRGNEEQLILTGTKAINGTGNGLNNRLTGNSANNVLNGGGGADVMAGGKGDDTYIVDNANDVVSEGSGAGTDTVIASVSHRLRTNIERLILTGTKAINGTGNGLNNRLTGNSANNVLEGKAGRDILTGKSGGDTFIYRSVNDSGITNSTRDIITDFDGAESDVIDLSQIDAYTATSGNQTFVYIGSDPFSGTQGEVRFASGILGVNTGTDYAADMQIKLNGITEFSSDFLIL